MESTYRTIQESDYQVFADMTNVNNQREHVYWCRTTTDFTAEKVGRMVTLAATRGRLITQVRQEASPVSLFVGFEHNGNALYSVGVVDTTRLDFETVWRQDTAHLFKGALDRNNHTFRIQLSDDQALIVGWMEEELNMVRHPGSSVWITDAQSMQQYVGIHSNE